MIDADPDTPPGPTCGDAGGRTADGSPCTRPAGWGRTARGGRCRDHHQDARVVARIDADEEDEPPPPPEHLSDAAAARWRWVNRKLVFGPAELLLLEEGLAAWDRVRECRDTLRREGLVAVNPDSGNPKRHPAAQELDSSLTQLRNCLRQLDLEMPDGPETP